MNSKLKEIKELIDLGIKIIKYKEPEPQFKGISVADIKDADPINYNKAGFNGDISNWNISNVKDRTYLFKESPKNAGFNGDISNWGTSNVEDMSPVFKSAGFNADTSKWDISNVNDRISKIREQSSDNNQKNDIKPK